MIRPVPLIQLKDQPTQRALGYVIGALQDIALKEIVDGGLLTDVVLVSGVANGIAHKLDRKPRGYLIVRRNGSAVVWDDLPTNDKILTLFTTIDVTVSLWVF